MKTYKQTRRDWACFVLEEMPDFPVCGFPVERENWVVELARKALGRNREIHDSAQWVVWTGENVRAALELTLEEGGICQEERRQLIRILNDTLCH